MLNGIPIYSLTIDELCEEDGVSMMSIVDQPAVEKDFLLFSKDQQAKKTFKYSLNEEKKIITGVALRCDYPIYRKDGKNEYYLTIDAEVIQKIVCKFMRDQHIKDVNLAHDLNVEGVYLIESFFLTDEHKLTYPEFDDVSNGSWIVSYKVDNAEVWKKIKKGELRGFSVELTGNMIENQNFTRDTGKAHTINKLLKIIDLYECITKSKNTAC